MGEEPDDPNGPDYFKVGLVFCGFAIILVVIVEYGLSEWTKYLLTGG